MSEINRKIPALRLARVQYTISWLKKRKDKKELFFAVSLHALWLQLIDLRNLFYDEFVFDTDEAFDSEIFEFDDEAEEFFGLTLKEADLATFFQRIVTLGDQLISVVRAVAFVDKPEVGSEQWVDKWGIEFSEDNIRRDRMAIRLGEQNLERSVLGEKLNRLV